MVLEVKGKSRTTQTPFRGASEEDLEELVDMEFAKSHLDENRY